MIESESQSIFIDQYYEMNPAFEDVLPDGTHLKDGMIVLIESPLYRMSVDIDPENFDPAKRYVARTLNRWCTVSPGSIKIIPGCPDVVTFVGVYADGGKIKRISKVQDAWIVKLDSLPFDPH